MSTKVTWLYGNPELDGPANDYHLYFDYADWSVHLEIKGKEVDLPPKLREELTEIYQLYDALIELVGRLVAHAEHRGFVKAYRGLLKRVGRTGFGIAPKEGGERGENDR